jgi:hypothetical protein
MKKYIWFILLLLFISCYPNYAEEEEITDTNEINSNSTDNWSFIDTMDTDDLISAIESSENIESKHIGIEGRKSYIYCCYEKLLETASDSLWVKLSYSKSPVMRYYAYKALFSRESTNLQSVRNRLIKDSSQVCYHTRDMINCLYILGELIERNVGCK